MRRATFLSSYSGSRTLWTPLSVMMVGYSCSFETLPTGRRPSRRGRVLHTEMVAEDGGVTIDFNRAFNPLAAFTQFSPSAVAPKSHLLNCEVLAGERSPDFPPDWK